MKLSTAAIGISLLVLSGCAPEPKAVTPIESSRDLVGGFCPTEVPVQKEEAAATLKLAEEKAESKAEEEAASEPAACVEQSSLLRDDAVLACHDAGLLYDRNLQTCSAATTEIAYKCDFNGISGAFLAVGVDASAVLLESLGSPDNPEDSGAGYIIDQCGTLPDGGPAVFLVKLVEKATGDVQLVVRYLVTQ